MGLLDMAKYAHNSQALEVAKNFAKWFLRWIKLFDRDRFDDILDFETGGMLEIWVQLFEMTGKEIYRQLIEKYYRSRLFNALLEGKDPLTNMHANTTIPEIIGCAYAYDVTGEKHWRDITEAYWRQAVTQRGTYATGGQTCGEIWTPKNEMSARIGDKNQEYCTVYNMMRLAGFLFRWTGDASYLDYCEKNLYNGIMAQSYWQGNIYKDAEGSYPNTGLLTYFLPFRPGSRKDWATETESFFCCHGTLVQSNAQLARGIYYQDNDALYICQYFDSKCEFKAGDVPLTLIQKRDALTGSFHMGSDSTGGQGISDITAKIPHNPNIYKACFRIETKNPVELTLKLRIPSWTSGWELNLNNKPVKPDSLEQGFAVIRRQWSNSDILCLSMPMRVRAVPLAGEESTVAFMYGPVLLAGLCAEERSLVSGGKRHEELLVHDNEREWGSWKSTFRVKGQQQGLRFIPLHDVGYERYTLHFPVK